MHYAKIEQAVEIKSAETPVAPLPANPIRVLVVDDHALVREAIHRALNSLPEVKLVVSVSNYQEAEMQATRLHPEIIWLDMHIAAHGNSIAEIPRLRKLSPEARIIVLADFEDKQEAFAAIMAGAHGYRSKEEVDPDEVVAMLRMVCRNELALRPAMITHLMQRLRSAALPLWGAEQGSGHRAHQYMLESHGITESHDARARGTATDQPGPPRP